MVLPILRNLCRCNVDDVITVDEYDNDIRGATFTSFAAFYIKQICIKHMNICEVQCLNHPMEAKNNLNYINIKITLTYYASQHSAKV